MSPEQVRRIELSLDVTLPVDYKRVLTSFPWPTYAGSTEASLWDDEMAIIENTAAQRHGFGGAPPWPQRFVFIGDEDDGCPYVLDCSNGRIVRTDHGNLETEPLEEYEHVSDLLAAVSVTWSAPGNPWWKIW